MKKNRASFFNDSTAYYNTGDPNMYNPNMYNPNMNSMPQNAPMMGSQSGFYMNPNNNDLESRLAKMERQINRLEHRVSILEQNSTNYTADEDLNVNNMFMV